MPHRGRTGWNLVSMLLAACMLVPSASAHADEVERLTFLTWSEYIDPQVVAEFEAEEGVSVRFVYFQTDYDRDQIMAETDGRGFDLMVVNRVPLSLYARRGWIAPLDRTLLPNARRVDPRWSEGEAAAATHAVPYFWGTMGIAYRADLVPAPLTSWRDLLAPDEALRGRIVMIKDTREMFGTALKALGHPLNSGDTAHIREAQALLESQKPYVHSYAYVSLSEQSTLVTGEVWAAMMYSGDALMIREHQPGIEYVLPEEGCSLWVDYLVVLRSSPRAALAHRFIDFLNRPDIAARNARFVYYATPNRDAEALLPADHLDDPIIYPPRHVLGNCEFEQKLPPRSRKLMNAGFSAIVN